MPYSVVNGSAGPSDWRNVAALQGGLGGGGCGRPAVNHCHRRVTIARQCPVNFARYVGRPDPALSYWMQGWQILVFFKKIFPYLTTFIWISQRKRYQPTTFLETSRISIIIRNCKGRIVRLARYIILRYVTVTVTSKNIFS